MIQEIVENIDTYIDEIKTTIRIRNPSPLFINTIIEGLYSYVGAIKTFKKYVDTNEAELALEKLQTLITVLEIRIDEIDNNIIYKRG